MRAVGRVLYVALGCTASLLGIIGVWVPGLPTTVFLLIALWVFSRSSQRLHAILMRIPVLKNALREAERFQREGTVPMGTKIVSQVCAWSSFILLSVLMRHVLVSATLGMLALACSIFMYKVPTASVYRSSKAADE